MFARFVCVLALLAMAVTVIGECTQPGCPPPNGTSAAPLTIRRFTLFIQHAWIHGRTMVTANGTVPGPKIEVNENDHVIVDVYNIMDNITTVVHWHGLFQYQTPQSDGVIGLTQCPIAPGDHMTYRFVASPAGTFWYHAHAHGQYTDGLYGPLIVHPTVEPQVYHDDVTLTIADFYKLQYSTMLSWFLSPESDSVEPLPDAISLNGLFSHQLSITASRSLIMRLRFINTASFSMYRISIDGMPLQVIECDALDITPYEIDRIQLNVAQRISVLLDFSKLQYFNASTKAIYIRVEAATDMYAVNYTEFRPAYNTNYSFNPIALATITLDEPMAIPNYIDAPKINTTHVMTNDTNLLDARPFNTFIVPNVTHSLQLNITFTEDSHNITHAYFNNITYNTNYYENSINVPYLFQLVANASTSIDIPKQGIQHTRPGVYSFTYGDTVEITLMNYDTGEHPFHLHGHNFWVVATSNNPEAETKYTGAYLRRDVVSVPAMSEGVNGTDGEPGWAKIRFIINNPGIWIFHCHIEWHVSQGLVTWFEMSMDRLSMLEVPSVENQQVCNNFAKYINPVQPANNANIDSSDYNIAKSTMIGIIIGGAVALLITLSLGYVVGKRSVKKQNALLLGDTVKYTRT